MFEVLRSFECHEAYIFRCHLLLACVEASSHRLNGSNVQWHMISSASYRLSFIIISNYYYYCRCIQWRIKLSDKWQVKPSSLSFYFSTASSLFTLYYMRECSVQVRICYKCNTVNDPLAKARLRVNISIAIASISSRRQNFWQKPWDMISWTKMTISVFSYVCIWTYVFWHEQELLISIK